MATFSVMADVPNPLFDSNGDPFSGAVLKAFLPGGGTTSTSIAIDSAGGSPQASITANAEGKWEVTGNEILPYIDRKHKWGIFANATDAAANTPFYMGPFDNVEQNTDAGSTAGQLELWLTGTTYNIPDLVKGSDDRFYRSLTDTNAANDPTSSAVNWEQVEFERIYNSNVTYALGDRSIGSDGMEYFSLIAANLNNNPVNDATSTNWRAADQLRSVDATGTVDVITATYIPAIGALKDELMVRLRASGANTSMTPTFAPNGLTAKTLVKGGNQALAANDISGAGHELLLVYNSTNDTWEILNPAVAAGSSNTDLSNLSATGSDKIAKAWANFDGTGTPALRDDLGISSITDHAVGQFSLNFDTAAADTNFAVLCTAGSRTVDTFTATTGCNIPTTAAARITTVDTTGQFATDFDNVAVVVFGG